MYNLFAPFRVCCESLCHPDTDSPCTQPASQLLLLLLSIPKRVFLASLNRLGLACKLNHTCCYNAPCILQSQRQLQLSLEAHGRYITSLIEREGLQHRLLPQLVAAAHPSLARTVPALAALTGAVAQGTSAQTSHQQTHYMPLPVSGGSDFSPHHLLAGGFAHLPPQVDLSSSAGVMVAARALDVSPSPLSRPAGVPPSNPFASISQGMYGEPSSPGLLLNTDLQAAAATWDDQQRSILTGAGSKSLSELPAAAAGRLHTAPSLNPSRPLDALALPLHSSASNVQPLPPPKADLGS